MKFLICKYFSKIFLQSSYKQGFEFSLVNVIQEAVVQTINVVIVSVSVLVFLRKLVKLGAKISVRGRVVNPKFVRENVQVRKYAVELVGGRPPRAHRQARKLAIPKELVSDFSVRFNENLTAPF